MTLEIVALALRFALASLFLLAGLSKLARRDEFAAAVRRYELLPPTLVGVVAALLPPFEVVCGASLAVGFGSAAVSALLAIALLGFSIAIGINLSRGREIDCGCFSAAAPRRITWLTVGRNLLLAAMAIAITIEAPTALSLDGLVFDASETVVTNADALAIGAAVTACLAAMAVIRELGRVYTLARAVGDGAGGGLR